MLRFRSSAKPSRRLITQLVEEVGFHCRRSGIRWLCGRGGTRRTRYADRLPSLLQPLPGLELPPSPPDLRDKKPTLVTTLPNGVRVASQDRPGPVACVGVVVDSGSVYETERSAGVSHLLERLAFHDTENRNLAKVARDVEATGGTLGASASRERMVYTYDTLRAYLPQAVEVLADCIRNPVFLRSKVDYQVED